jgi:hypothetical protein
MAAGGHSVNGPGLVKWLEERGCELGDRWLGDDARRIRAWREGSDEPTLGVLDRVLTKLDIHMDELPDDLRHRVEGEAVERANRRNAKLTDSQLRALHLLHTKGGYSIRQLAERVWKRAGHKSPEGATAAIRRGFRRLYLPIQHRHPSEFPHLPRCEFIKKDGTRCSAFPVAGETLCFPHHPAHREQVRRSTLRAVRARLAKEAA